MLIVDRFAFTVTEADERRIVTAEAELVEAAAARHEADKLTAGGNATAAAASGLDAAAEQEASLGAGGTLLRRGRAIIDSLAGRESEAVEVAAAGPQGGTADEGGDYDGAV